MRSHLGGGHGVDRLSEGRDQVDQQAGEDHREGEGGQGVPEDAGVLVDGDHEGDGTDEEEDETDDEHVVEESGVVLVASVL